MIHRITRLDIQARQKLGAVLHDSSCFGVLTFTNWIFIIWQPKLAIFDLLSDCQEYTSHSCPDYDYTVNSACAQVYGLHLLL
jgi:hypothetical protein